MRSWTRLNRCYDEVRPTGLWLFRKDAQKDQRFPSLFAAARPNVGRPKKQAEEPTPAVVARGTDATNPTVE